MYTYQFQYNLNLNFMFPHQNLLTVIAEFTRELPARFNQALLSALTAIVAMIGDSMPLFLLAAGFIVFDAVTSFFMQRRLRKVALKNKDDPRRAPCRTSNGTAGDGSSAFRSNGTAPLNPELGKFSSNRFGYTMQTILYLFVMLVLSVGIDTLVLKSENGYAARFVAGLFIGWQGWSILENISSAQNAGWAKFLQRYLVNKAERYLEMPLDEFTHRSRSAGDADRKTN